MVGMLATCFVSSSRHSDKFWSVYKLDQDQAGFSAGLALVPWWLLLVMVVGDVTVTVVKDATSGLGQDILS